MGERHIEGIESLRSDIESPEVENSPAAVSKRDVRRDDLLILVEINYPEPTLLSLIVRDVAKWSGHCFVMEPAINTKLQIFAPRKLSPQNAYELFLASLSVVSLRAVHVGPVVKIVPIQLIVSA